jgi:AAA domain
MGRHLRVRSVALLGSSEPHVWEFPKGVTVIVGASGGGKTSLLNLIKFGFGGEAPITKTIEGAARGVALEVEVGDQTLLLSRGFHSRKSILTVSEGDALLGEYSTKNSKSRPWISDLLLQGLDIPRVRIPASKSSKSHQLTSVSFQDLFAYCYLDQDAIDQETVNDRQSYAGTKRPWTFELLHGMVDAETAALEVEREETAEEAVKRQEELDSVERFVQTAELPASAEEIQRRIASLSSTEREIETEIAAVEAEARGAAAEQASESEIEAGVEDELRSARQDASELERELAEVRRAANQIQRDLATANEGDAARRTLEPLPYVLCPRCEQSIEARETATDRCVLCLQAESVSPVDVRPTRQLTAQLEETRALSAQIEEAVEKANDRVERLRVAVADQRQLLALARDKSTAPLRARLVQLQEQLGRSRGERQILVAGLPIERAVETERTAIAATRPKVDELADQALRRREDLAVGGRARLEEVSRLFSEILHAFSLPWLKSAEVDRNTYLPLVNGLSLRKLSSGGMKTTTNVAYYLGVFITGLRDSATLTPRFLMLDSIRKDSGANEEDLARSDRIYSFLQTLQELRSGPNPVAQDFQLLVVDNDLPPNFSQAFNTMRIDLENPLVRGVE